MLNVRLLQHLKSLWGILVWLYERKTSFYAILLLAAVHIVTKRTGECLNAPFGAGGPGYKPSSVLTESTHQMTRFLRFSKYNIFKTIEKFLCNHFSTIYNFFFYKCRMSYVCYVTSKIPNNCLSISLIVPTYLE